MPRIVLINIRDMSDSQMQYLRDLLESELSNNPRFSGVQILLSEKTYKPVVVDTDVYDTFEERVSEKESKKSGSICTPNDGTKVQTK